MKDFIIRAIFFLFGLIILTFGVSLTIVADLGAGAWDAVNVGLKNKIGFTVGTWVIVIGTILIITNALLAKEKLEIFAFVTIFIIGGFVDFWIEIVMDSWELTALVTRIPLLAIGIVSIAMGVALYIQPKLPLNPIDNFMVSMQKRFDQLDLKKSKTLTESLAFVIALVLGGPIGIGTIIILLFIGPAIQYFDPKAHKLFSAIIPKS
ncbi:YczE/YyaS/YitT family protein [Pontibacillus litoralis]|uniref:Permease n=1 Tax=Pontibacillus litoralis JSM 072002 TaxID=1385512 RepID=A0A0A5GAM2_9BACI|nr:membrane protein [Pontibacillus litoralis]KGX88165.1 hypothetical protein N784_10520 [Pontibacillus litoralis JSM 072002]